jgi:hypothetical protein
VLHELLELRLIDHPRRGRVDELGIIERVALRRRGAEELIGNPEVARHERRDVLVDRDLNLRVAEQVAEPRHGQLLRCRASHHVDVSGERFLETVACDQRRGADDQGEERSSFHCEPKAKMRRLTSDDGTQRAHKPVE